LMSEVARERNDHHTRVASGSGLEPHERAVGAAVIHQHDFVRPTRQSRERTANSPHQLVDTVLLVMQRDGY